jgi:diguanylate cyclase (GGDEF)-like protein/PAS domain S-box-containing protein
VIDPRLASTFARMSFLVIGAVGGAFTLFLALRGQDRALSLIPTWILFLIWIFAAAMTLTGRLAGDVVVSSLVAGLVLILVLIGFAVIQFAFRSREPLYGTTPDELQLRALAVDGAGSAVWEWNARRDEIKVSPIFESSLGLGPGELSTKVDDFIKHLHPADRDRFRLMLWSMQERTWAKIRTDFRMRHADNTYRWFELEASSVPNADMRALRCVGLIRDVTDAKRAHERLLHDAVHDSLTGLPNRELMLDRLSVGVMRAKSKDGARPSVFCIDIDKFKSVNVSFGLVVGDSLLLTVARRLQSHLGAQDTLARVAGDRFAIVLVTEHAPQDLAALAERVRRSLRAPIKIAGQEIVLTGSVGIAVYDGGEGGHLDLYKEAEIAMYRAKRGGSDRVEIFRPEMRADRDDRVTIESDLRKALTKNQIRVLYQPIIYLPTEELAGFEALVRWEHPKRGMMNPADFIPVAEESDLIVRLGSHVLLKAAQEAARWQRELPRDEDPLFVSVNISSRQIFRQNLVQEIRHILGRNIVPKGTLRLEITESLVMENPEQATEILEWLRGAGAELAIDDFGTGYSSLAYLQRFPFDTIKIDKSLVQSSGANNGAGSAIVRSIVALAHELGKKVVAEGVETPEDAGYLRSIGCQYAQGFYYGEPMSDRDVLQLLKIVRKAEHKLRPRGFFRAKAKGAPGEQQKVRKRVGKRTPADAAEAAIAASGGMPPPPAVNGHGSALPNRTVRPRSRPANPAMLPPPPPRNGAGFPPYGGGFPSPVHQNGGLPPPIPGGFPPTASSPLHDLIGGGMLPPPGPFADGPPYAPFIGAPPPAPFQPGPFTAAPPVPLQHDGMGDGDFPPPAPMAAPPSSFGAPAPFAAMPAHEDAAATDGLPPAFDSADSDAIDDRFETAAPDMPPEPPHLAFPPPQPARTSPMLADGADPQPMDQEPDMGAIAEALRRAEREAPHEPAPEFASPPAPALSPLRQRIAAAAPQAASPPPRPAAPAQRPAPARPAQVKRAVPDFSGLPPAMAQSLAKLAGVPWPPQPDGNAKDARQLEDETAGAPAAKPRSDA